MHPVNIGPCLWFGRRVRSLSMVPRFEIPARAEFDPSENLEVRIVGAGKTSRRRKQRRTSKHTSFTSRLELSHYCVCTTVSSTDIVFRYPVICVCVCACVVCVVLARYE